MEVKIFNPKDRVRLISSKPVGWETSFNTANFINDAGLTEGSIYTVNKYYDEGDGRNNKMNLVGIILPGIRRSNSISNPDGLWVFHPNHFELVTSSTYGSDIVPSGLPDASPIEKRLFEIHTHAEIAHVMDPDQMVYTEKDVIQLLKDIRDGCIEL